MEPPEDITGDTYSWTVDSDLTPGNDYFWLLMQGSVNATSDTITIEAASSEISSSELSFPTTALTSSGTSLAVITHSHVISPSATSAARKATTATTRHRGSTLQTQSTTRTLPAASATSSPIPPSSSQTFPVLSTAIKVGTSFGAVVVVALLGTVVYYFRKRGRKNQTVASNRAEDTWSLQETKAFARTQSEETLAVQELSGSDAKSEWAERFELDAEEAPMSELPIDTNSREKNSR